MRPSAASAYYSLIYLALNISRRVQFIYQKEITLKNNVELLFIGNEGIMFTSKTLIDLWIIKQNIKILKIFA